VDVDLGRIVTCRDGESHRCLVCPHGQCCRMSRPRAVAVCIDSGEMGVIETRSSRVSTRVIAERQKGACQPIACPLLGIGLMDRDMDRLFSETRATDRLAGDLGRSTLMGRKSRPQLLDVAGRPVEVRRSLRQQCPSVPGVYGMVDGQGELIYVGMSGRLRDRLLTYFTKGPPEAKEQRVAARAHRVMWELVPHELVAQLRELELIRRWSPRFNAAGRPGRRENGFIYLTRSDAPRFRTAGRLPPGYRRCWGPIPLTRRTRAAVKRLNTLFLLRDCPDRTTIRFTQQHLLFADHLQVGCVRGQLGTCLAPCAGSGSRDAYAGAVDDACRLLDGRDCRFIEELEDAMRQAAAGQRYEQAASHRDDWQSLNLLVDQLDLVRRVRDEFAGVHVLPGTRKAVWWLIVAAGKVARIVRQPGSPNAARRCLELLDDTFSRATGGTVEDYEQMRLVRSWHRQHPQVRGGIIAFNDARRYCSHRC